jgi:hypothetical protein
MNNLDRYQPIFNEADYPPPPGETPVPQKKQPAPVPQPPVVVEPIQKKRGSQAVAPVIKRPVKRKRRGGQPGNSNAVKHGLYIHHKTVRNTNPIEKAALFDLTDHIQALKNSLKLLYELGLKSTDLHEVNDTVRSLSLGSIALNRLINTHEAYSAVPLPDDLLGIDYYDESFQLEDYIDPPLEEIEAKLKELGA